MRKELHLYFKLNYKNYLPFCSHVSTTVRLHYLKSNKTSGNKKRDGNYPKVLRDFLNKSPDNHSITQQLYGHLLPIMQTNQEGGARHVRYCRILREKRFFYGLLHMNASMTVDLKKRIHRTLDNVYIIEQ